LLPAHSYRATDFLQAAKALGSEVVVASDRRHPLEAAMGDRTIEVYMRRPDIAADAIVEFAEEHALDAIVAADEQGVEIAAIAAQRLGLAHNPPQAAAATRDKARLRRALATSGVRQPEFRVLDTGADVGALAAEIGWPVVIKPVSLAASQGVIRVDDAQSAAAAETRIRAILEDADEDPAAPLLLERFIPGSEVAVEGLLRAGELDVLAIFDKPDPLDGPYFEETIYVTPSRLAPRVQAEIRAASAAAAAALGLREGPVHAELRVNADGPWVLEVAARSIGGLCSRSLRFGLGVSLEQLILRHALGMPIRDLAPAFAASGVMMLPIPRAGVLQAVNGQDAARAVPGIEGLEITIVAGRPVRPLPERSRYLGFLFARGETPAEVEQALRRAFGELTIVIDGG
jgi:biotin carboxylase